MSIKFSKPSSSGYAQVAYTAHGDPVACIRKLSSSRYSVQAHGCAYTIAGIPYKELASRKEAKSYITSFFRK